MLPESSLSPELIVCERSGRWAVALRAALADAAVGPRVRETRSLADCWQELARRPSSFVVAELTLSAADALADRLARLERQFPLAAVAVVADRSLAELEPLVRQAGAVHFVTSPREADALARLASRHLERAAAPRRSVRETVLARLPWAPPDEQT